MTEEKMRKQLNKFSKSQIIDTIIKTYPFGSFTEKLITNLEYLHTDELNKKHSNAIKKEQKETHKYLQWKNEMISKYGSDGKVRLIDIPNDELLRGADLESKMKATREKECKLSEKVDDILRI